MIRNNSQWVTVARGSLSECMELIDELLPNAFRLNSLSRDDVEWVCVLTLDPVMVQMMNLSKQALGAVIKPPGDEWKNGDNNAD